ncbi:AAA family ATPase [Desulfogranum mediterraneum]|uniref:AAA family ATPase n=1 Tax=Desulfogranum mediterraneum TaxID=160661 RepID=UPI00041EF24E|nr:AAA family ATPase [Desulfogranum mediterraneum]
MTTSKPKLSVQLVTKTPEVTKNFTRIIENIDGANLQNNLNAEKVDILVLEIGSDPAKELETISLLLKENVVGNLFLTSAKTTTDVLLPALRAGAKEFFAQPIKENEVINAVNSILVDHLTKKSHGKEPGHLGKMYSILGAKGGVGTTTFAVNLATSIKNRSSDSLVALIDMNRLIGEVCLFLDIESETNWEEISRNLGRLDGAYLQSAMAKHSSGVFVLPAPERIDTATHLSTNSLFQLLRAIRQFFDYIVIDCGMYLGDDSYKIFAESESVYLISTLSLPCLINVRKIRDSLSAAGSLTNGKVKVIANRYEKKSQISLSESQKILGSQIELTIPNDYSLAMKTVNNGKVFSELSKRSSVTAAYRNLAASLVENPSTEPKGFFRLFN